MSLRRIPNSTLIDGAKLDNAPADINSELIIKEDKSNKGIPNGYAELDSNGKVPNSQLPPAGFGDMEKSVYDTDDSGIIDNAEKVNGLTVKTAVPNGAVFTDTTYSDAQIKTKYENNADTNAFTDAEKTKLLNIENNAQVNTVDSVSGKTGVVTLVKGDVGLSNVNNTSDLNKPISTDTQTALDGKEASFTKNSAFNKNFGTTAGTVLAGNTILGKVGTKMVDETAIADTFIIAYNSTSGNLEYIPQSSGGGGSVTTLDTLEVSGTQSTGVVSNFRVSQAGTLAKFSAYLETAPTDADFTVDFKVNGTVQATATISDGTNSGTTTSFTSNVLAEGDLITYDITAIGSTVAGSGLTLLTNLA